MPKLNNAHPEMTGKGGVGFCRAFKQAQEKALLDGGRKDPSRLEKHLNVDLTLPWVHSTSPALEPCRDVFSLLELLSCTSVTTGGGMLPNSNRLSLTPCWILPKQLPMVLPICQFLGY